MPSWTVTRRSTRRGIALGGVTLALCLPLTACSSQDGEPTSSPSGSTRSVGANDRQLAAALAAFQAGRTSEAAEIYREVLKKDARNVVAHYNLGLIAQTANDLDEAAFRYRSALDADARYAPALYNLAIVTNRLGNPNAAVNLYRRAIAVNPRDANSLFNLGLLLRQLGKEKDAIAELNKAIAIDPALANRLPRETPGPTPSA